MFDSILTYLNEGSVYYGLEICQYADAEQFHLLEIQKKKEELFILREETFGNLQEVAETLNTDIPIFLVINTDKVLTKIINSTTQENNEALVHQAFPNLDFNGFYYEVVRTADNNLISICRKEEISVYIEQLNNLKLGLRSIFLGVAPISSLLGYLDTKNVFVSNSQVDMTGRSIAGITPLPSDDLEIPDYYDVSGLKIGRKYILAFASVLGHLSKTWSSTGNLQDKQTFLKNEFVNKRHFKLLLKSALAAILGLLLLNFLIFNHYFQEVGNIQDSLAVNNANKEHLIQLKSRVKVQENRVNAVLSMSNSKTSFYLDELAKSIPQTITLSEILYQPLTRPIRDSKAIELVQNTIVIMGEVNDSGDFYTWLEDLEKHSWIYHIETTDYDYGTKNVSNFAVKISLDEQ